MKVPQYQADQVTPQGLPGERFDPRAPIGAFGGGQATEGAFAQARGMAQDSAAIFADQAKEAAQQADNDVLNQARVDLNDQERAMKEKVSALKGRDALGTTSTLNEDLRKYSADYESKLYTPEQKQAYRGMVTARREYLLNWGNDREMQAKDELHVGGLKAGTASSIERAASDPSTIGLESRIVDDNALKLALHYGLDPEQTQQARRQAQSDLHSQVLDRLVATGSDLDAKAFYDANKDKFILNQGDRAAAMVQTHSMAAEAERAVNEAWSATKGAANATKGGDPADYQSNKPTFENEKDAVDAVKAVTAGMDQKVQDQAVERAMHRFTLERVAQKQTTDKIYMDASHLLEKPENLGKSPTTVVPPDQWQQLSLQERDNLFVYAGKLLKPTKESDPRSLTRFDATPKSKLSQMDESDMLKYLTSPEEGYGPVSTDDYKNKLLPVWRNAKFGEDNAQFKITEQDQKEIFRAIHSSPILDWGKVTTEQHLLDPSKKALNESYRALYTEVSNRLEAAAADKPMKRLDQKQRDQIINDFVIEKSVQKPKTTMEKIGNAIQGGGTPLLGATATTGLAAPILTWAGGKIFGSSRLPVTDQERERIVATISRAGGTPSEEKIQTLKYAQSKGASPAELLKLAGQE